MRIASMWIFFFIFYFFLFFFLLFFFFLLTKDLLALHKEFSNVSELQEHGIL